MHDRAEKRARRGSVISFFDVRVAQLISSPQHKFFGAFVCEREEIALSGDFNWSRTARAFDYDSGISRGIPSQRKALLTSSPSAAAGSSLSSLVDPFCDVCSA